LVRTHGIAPWVARILVGRGAIDPDKAPDFLRPETYPYHDPHSLPGLDGFLGRIEQAIRNKERVIIHGDYDADGVTSAAILSFAMKRVGLESTVFLPNRFEGGYGIHPEWVEAQKDAGIDLIVTTDCGSSAVDACRKASEIGIDLIITDHHTPNPDLEGVVAHINPRLPDSKYPFEDLCGAGVALKLAQALTALVPPSFQAEYKHDLPIDLAMIGTIADVMPIVGENRRIVVDGLERVRNAPRLGLQALLEKARCDPKGVNAETVAFQIAPRLNAAGRLRSPDLAFSLLTEEDPEKVQELAAELEKANRERKTLGKAAVESALKRLESEPQDSVILMADAGWHRGILGILAARLGEDSGLPVFVASLEEGVAHGSARVPKGFNAAGLLEAASDFTQRGGGHAGAAGFTVSEPDWDAFADAIRAAVLAQELQATPPEISVDAFIEGTEGLDDVLREVGALAPFGEGFPTPVFALCGYEAAGQTQLFGDNHLKVNIGSRKRPLEAVAFGMADWAEEMDRKKVDILIQHGENHWNGQTSLRPKVLAIRPSLVEETEAPSREEVTRIKGREGQSPVVWDVRGGSPLEAEEVLRIGYGPEWRGWWFENLPGDLDEWKKKVWGSSTALPASAWPGSCSVGYSGEVPENWEGAVLEILWPPLRKADCHWLAEVVSKMDDNPLIRLVYGPEEVTRWTALLEAEPTRDNIATLYRALGERTNPVSLAALPLSATTIGVCLEILSDLSLIDIAGEDILKKSNPPKVNLTDSKFARAWTQQASNIRTWSDRVTHHAAADLVQRWLS